MNITNGKHTDPSKKQKTKTKQTEKNTCISITVLSNCVVARISLAQYTQNRRCKGTKHFSSMAFTTILKQNLLAETDMTSAEPAETVL